MGTAILEQGAQIPMTQLGSGGGEVPPSFSAGLANDDWHGPGPSSEDILALHIELNNILRRGDELDIPDARPARLTHAAEATAQLGLVDQAIQTSRRTAAAARAALVLPRL